MCSVEFVIERGFTINGTAEDQLQLGVCNTLWLISIPAIDQRANTAVSQPEALSAASRSKHN